MSDRPWPTMQKITRLISDRQLMEDEYAKLWQMYGDLETKRDRMREAFEKFINQVHENALEPDKLYIYEGRARAALKEVGDE